MFKKQDMPAWSFVRARIKPKFEKAGIRSCELEQEGYTNSTGEYICTRGNPEFRTFAHSLKVIDRTCKEHVEEVIWACSSCHLVLESLGREPMYKKVHEIIARRPVPVESIFRK